MKHWTKISVVFSLMLYWFISNQGVFLPARLSDEQLRNYIGLVAQIAATMLGFLLTALSILASISGHRLLVNMQKTGHFHVLLTRFFLNCVAFALAGIVALAGYLLKTHLAFAGQVSTVIFFFSFLLLCDVGWRFWLVLTELGSSE